MSTGALMGARGNSGVILSQILRGTSEILGGLTDGDALDGSAVHRPPARGPPTSATRRSPARSRAPSSPWPGPRPTRPRRASRTAPRTPAAVVEAAAQGARDALARTPTMLESLRLAGVVDAGGRGLVVVLDALAEVVSGVQALGRRRRPARSRCRVRSRPSRPITTAAPPTRSCSCSTPTTPPYPPCASELDALGDSLVVVGGDRLWNVHVHVDDAGAAVEAAMAAGRPYRLRITHLETVVPTSGPGRRRAPSWRSRTARESPICSAVPASASFPPWPGSGRRRPSCSTPCGSPTRPR